MRAREFIRERKQESIVKIPRKPHKYAEFAMPNAHRVAGTADRTYDFYRIQMYVAGMDGVNCSLLNQQSWVGRNNTAHPYTPIESEMLKHAYAQAGVEWDDALKPNPEQKSCEHPDVKKAVISPMRGFKGFK
jgi:hypothetical protein